MQFLRQATAATVKSDPLVTTSTGAVNAGATIQKANVLVCKAGGASAAAHANQGAADAGAAYDAVGSYNLTLDATDTATAGLLDILIGIALCNPIHMRFMVLNAAMYDAMISASTLLTVNQTQLLGQAVPTPGTAGIPQVEVKSMDADPTSQIQSACSTALNSVINAQPKRFHD